MGLGPTFGLALNPLSAAGIGAQPHLLLTLTAGRRPASHQTAKPPQSHYDFLSKPPIGDEMSVLLR